MHPRTLLLGATLLTATTFAQVNQAGTFQIGAGLQLGLFATDFASSYTVPFFGVVKYHDTDGAATSSFPIDFQYGLSDRFSLGLYIEPGNYLDSNATRSNGFFLAGIEPRFYLVNKDRFAWFANVDAGLSVLRIKDTDGAQNFTDSYAGGHFRIGTQVQFYFGEHFGLHFGMNYGAHNMPWRSRDPENETLNALAYEAKLKTSGVQFGMGAQFKF